MLSYSKIQITDQDILCGRGRGLESFPGNQLFRGVIKEHAADYSAQGTCRAERSRMVRLISDRLASEGMRFIKRVNKGWDSLEEYDAKLKVGHALRDAGSRLQSEESKKQVDTKKRQKKDWKAMHFDQFVGVVSDDEGSVTGIREEHAVEHQQEDQHISIEEVDRSIDLDDSSLPVPITDKQPTTTLDAVLSLAEEEDKWAPLLVDMKKPFQPQLSYKSLSAAIPIEGFELTNDMVEADNGDVQQDNVSSKEDFPFDVSFSEVFLRFLEDSGETDIIAGQDINPDMWLSSTNRRQDWGSTARF